MIAIKYDPLLIEHAACLAARTNDEQHRYLRRQIDPLYALPADEDRERAFSQAYRDSFVRFGLDCLVRDALAEFPLVTVRVDQCVVHEAARSKSQSAELFVKREAREVSAHDRTVVIQISPQSLVEPDGARGLLLRELMHISDMLDDEFHYSPDAVDGLPYRQNLVRDRYLVLWAMYVDGRLVRAQRVSDDQTRSLMRDFERAFTVRGCAPTREAFDAAYHAGSLDHPQLLQWACEPEQLVGRPPSNAATAGNACPFCSFPTFDWFNFSGPLGAAAMTALRAIRPAWDEGSGACRQCVETYLAVSDSSLKNEALLKE